MHPLITFDESFIDARASKRKISAIVEVENRQIPPKTGGQLIFHTTICFYLVSKRKSRGKDERGLDRVKKESGKRNLHGHFAKSLGRDDEPIKNQATKQQIFVRFPAFPGKGPEKLNFPGRENPWSYFWILTGFG